MYKESKTSKKSRSKNENKLSDEDLQICNFDNICEDEKKNDSKHILIPTQPFRACLIGSSGSGKTNFAVNLITRYLKVDKLYIVSKHLEQPKMRFIVDYYRKIEEKTNKKCKTIDFKILEIFTNDLDELPYAEEMNPDLNNIVCFDDCMLERDQSKIIDMYIKGRHSNVTVINIVQSFYQTPRAIRLNTSLFCLFNIPSQTDIVRIHSEISPDISKEVFIKMFRKAMSKNYNFLMIDTSTKVKMLRYRINLDESPFSDEE
jgi:hypothetical protein